MKKKEKTTALLLRLLVLAVMEAIVAALCLFINIDNPLGAVVLFHAAFCAAGIISLDAEIRNIKQMLDENNYTNRN